MNDINLKNAALFFGLLMLARSLILWGAGAALAYSFDLGFEFLFGQAILIIVGFEAIRYDPTKGAILSDLSTIKIFLTDLVISSNVQERLALENSKSIELNKSSQSKE